MNILVIGKFYTEGFALHIAETLDDMGHDTVRFEPGAGLTRVPGKFGQRVGQATNLWRNITGSLPAMRARQMRGLWRLIEGRSIDVVLVCHDFLWPREVDELKRKTGATIALWFPDSVANIGRGMFMNSAFDALFFKDPHIVHTLGSVLRTPVYYLPECFNEKKHWVPDNELDDDPRYRADLVIVGNPHAYRVAFFEQLSTYDLKFWGNAPALWLDLQPAAISHQGRPVLNQEKARAFRGAKIALNNLYYGELWGVNVRTFEIAGAGAFQMLDWRPGLEQLFRVGSELVCFTGIDDLRTRIDYWLPRHDERRAIAEAGMRRAHAEHTYRLRLELLLGTLVGSEKGFPLPQIEYRGRRCQG